MKTLSPVLGDEPLVARDVVGPRRGGILCLSGGTGLWWWA